MGIKQLFHEAKRIAEKLEISDLTLFSNMNANCVASGVQYGQPVVLKLSHDKEALRREALALTIFKDYGAVQVMTHERDFLLLPRIMPGVSLKSYFPDQDEKAVTIACTVIRRLHQAPHHSQSLPHMKDLFAAFDGGWGIPQQDLKKAKQVAERLLETGSKDICLHGDLHHDNILQKGEGWVVIDPKGVVGESAYEVAAFISNPMPELLDHHSVKLIVHKRIQQFGKLLGLDEKRILDWCFVQIVLGWSWALEDGCPPEYFKQMAKIFDDMGRLGQDEVRSNNLRSSGTYILMRRYISSASFSS